MHMNVYSSIKKVLQYAHSPSTITIIVGLFPSLVKVKLVPSGSTLANTQLVP